ncbi:MAG: hypothetical protein PHG20_10790 [Geobacteraceae bacterium]|nr:hypothetical protein [Geobacteraceae bacterium]
MSSEKSFQRCAVCAWRADCQKKFCVHDGGARCPDFTRDITLGKITENRKELEK